MQPMNRMHEWLSRILDAAPARGVRPQDFLLVVDVSSQQAHLFLDGRHLAAYPVSTSRHGVGAIPDSLATPPGWHRVAARHGLDEPLGRVFRSREPQPECFPFPGAEEQDLILSRILHLEGLETGRNTTSFDRYIYIHGTNREDLLGQPASRGCVRMANRAVVEVFNLTLRHEMFCWIGTPADV